MPIKYRQRGFTLLELIVVLVIMSVILAVTAPRLAGREQFAILRGVGHDIQSLATAARARAVLNGQIVGLMLIADGREIRLVGKAGDNSGIANIHDNPTLVDLLPLRRFPKTIHVEFQADGPNDNDMIRFRPDGSADGGEFRISDTRGGELMLRLVEPLGQLRVIETS